MKELDSPPAHGADQRPWFATALLPIAACVAGFMSIVIGANGLIGAISGWQLIDASGVGPPITISASLIAVLLGVALLVAAPARLQGRTTVLVRILAGVSLVVALASLASVLLGATDWASMIPVPWAAGAPVSDPTAVFMPIPTATSCALIALAVLLDTGDMAIDSVAEGAALVALLIGSIALAGFFYGAEELYSIGGTAASLSASVVIVVLAGGALSARSEARFLRPLTDPGTTGKVMRRMLPSLLAVPVIGWIAFWAYQQHLVPDRHLVAISVVSVLVAIVIAGRWTASRVNVIERREHAATADNARLAAAIEQSSESVVITDPAGRIEYVNPAFVQSSGFSREESIGHSIRTLLTEDAGPAFQHALDATLAAGRSWYGELVHRRRDGSRIVEETVISPVRDASGTLINVVAARRDVTAQRELAARLDRTDAERAEISGWLVNLRPGATVRETAQLICERAALLPGVSSAIIAVFRERDAAEAIAGADGAGRDIVGDIQWPASWPAAARERIRTLRARLEGGVFAEAWTPIPGHPVSDTFGRLGIQALATAPIRADGELRAFLQFESAEEGPDRLAARIPALRDFCAVAQAMLAPGLAAEEAARLQRARIQSAIARTAFVPVFQPLVDLDTREVVGYEALTRFADDAPADRRFSDAVTVGLGRELEEATLAAALDAAEALPAGRFLDLNVSADLLLHNGTLRHLLANRGRPLVVELTEHIEVTDYAQVREAIAALGTDARLAVDDAGAGFATLRHILELNPAIVKLDRALVAGIDGDPVRRALVAGLVSFAGSTGITLVAEGVETEAERLTLQTIGIRIGQGYLLGRPEPVRGASRPVRATGVARPARRNAGAPLLH